MKNLIKPSLVKHATLIIFLAFIQAIAWAQDSNSATNKTTQTTSVTESENWYVQPWVWVVGGIVLILLIIALVRGNSGNSNTDRVIVSKTTTIDKV